MVLKKNDNDISKVFDFKGNEVRTVIINNDPWFVARDIANALGYVKTRNAIQNHVDDEDKNTALIQGGIGNPNKTVINESGMYSLILNSKLPAAKEFKRWVTSVVLPEIRKHGSFSVVNNHDSYMIDDPIKRAQRWIEEENKRKQLSAENEVMKPKAFFADSVKTSEDSILVSELAKIVSQNGVKIGGNRLFIWLRENGYLIKRKGSEWNMPTQRSMELRLFEIKESSHQAANGIVKISKTPKVTGKGQIYFVNKFNKLPIASKEI